MDNDFTHLKDWGDYQSFNVENKKNVEEVINGYAKFNIKSTDENFKIGR